MLEETQAREILQMEGIDGKWREILKAVFQYRGIGETGEPCADDQSTEFYGYLLLLGRLDLVTTEPNWPGFLEFVKTVGVHVNDSFAHSEVLPFVLSFPFVLSELILTGKAMQAVAVWCEVMGCKADFCQGMYSFAGIVTNRGQIRTYLHELSECDLVFTDDISLGWNLSTIVFTEVEHVIDRDYAFYN